MIRLTYFLLIFFNLSSYSSNPSFEIVDTIAIVKKSKRIIFQTAEIEKYRHLFKNDFVYIIPNDNVTSWQLPFAMADSCDLRNVKIISPFAVYRKSNLKGHKHSGIDIVPLKHEKSVHVYPVANGTVCFVRIDPPFSTVVIKHKIRENTYVYSSYIHLKDVCARKGQHVDSNTVIGQLYTHDEAWKYNGPYDHLHLEIRKRFDDYGCATYLCMNLQKLEEFFYNPLIFLEQRL